MKLRTLLLAVVAAGSLSACAPSTGDTPTTTTVVPTTVAPTTTLPPDARTEPWETSLDNPDGSARMTLHYCQMLGGNSGYVYYEGEDGHGTCFSHSRNKLYTW